LSLGELIEEVAILKDEAKLFRDSRDYDGAISALQVAVDLIDESGWEKADSTAPRSELDRKVAWHLADCLGMQGGNYRRNKELERAIECFTRGAIYEQDARNRISSSYNTVNAIVAPIEAGMRGATSQEKALRQAVATLEYQMFDPEMAEASRRLDRWAWADLGQCKLLLGDLDGAEAAYQRFKELGDLSSIRSSREVLTSIHNALQAQGDQKAAVVAAGINRFFQSAL
jgi:tetratricopeptide (TPR) repeat protein